MLAPRIVDPDWQEILKFNGILAFEQLWIPPAPALPVSGNQSTFKLWLRSPLGGEIPVYLKRREDGQLSALDRLFRRKLPLENEVAQIARLRDLGIAVPKVLWFESAAAEGRVRTVLLTEALEDFISLNELLTAWRRPALLDNGRRRLILDAVSEAVRKLHDADLVHNELLPERILVRFEDRDVRRPIAEVGLIDLERCRRDLLGVRRKRDLFALHTSAPAISQSERLRFMRSYLADSGPRASRRVIRRLARESAR